MKKQKKQHRPLPFLVYLILFIFIVLVSSMTIVILLWYAGNRLGIFGELTSFGVALILLLSSVALALSFVSTLGNKFLFSSVKRVARAAKQIADGDFSQRLTPPKEKEMSELVDSFNDMAEKLGRNEMLASGFVNNMSHEFRNPLSAIRGYAQLLEDDTLSPEQRREYLAVIEDKTLGLSELVNSILELSKLEKNPSSFKKEKFSLDEQLRQAILSLQTEWSKKNITVSVDMQTVSCEGIKELLYDVWQNLLDNAIKYTGANGRVDVMMKRQEDCILVRIADNGIGMDEETKERMFDRFYRGENIASRPGNGLGMPIVKEILALCGGQIDVESIANIGTIVTVRLANNK